MGIHGCGGVFADSYTHLLTRAHTLCAGTIVTRYIPTACLCLALGSCKQDGTQPVLPLPPLSLPPHYVLPPSTPSLLPPSLLALLRLCLLHAHVEQVGRESVREKKRQRDGQVSTSVRTDSSSIYAGACVCTRARARALARAHLLTRTHTLCRHDRHKVHPNGLPVPHAMIVQARRYSTCPMQIVEGQLYSH